MIKITTTVIDGIDKEVEGTGQGAGFDSVL
jgi:hypothetical protein